MADELDAEQRSRQTVLDGTVATLLYKHRPMKALWLALTDSNVSNDVPLAIVNDARCGLDAMTTTEDGGMVNRRLKFLDCGATPLMMAAHVDNVDRTPVIEGLLRAGASPHCSSGVDALYLAATSNNVSSMDALVSHGAVINRPLYPPLVAAASEGHYDAVHYLLSKGADVSAAGSNGYTALHVASCQFKSKVIGVLVEAGADVDGLMDGDYSPLNCAITSRSTSAVQELLAFGATTDVDDLIHASAKGKVLMVKALLDAGANVNGRSDRGVTALQPAARFSNIDIMELLLWEGADPTIAESSGRLPLSYGGGFRVEEGRVLRVSKYT